MSVQACAESPTLAKSFTQNGTRDSCDARIDDENLRRVLSRRDNFSMRGIAWIVVSVGLWAGCFDTPQAVLDDIACQKICTCAQVADCQDQCIAFVAPVSQECFDFTTTNAQTCALILDSIMTGGVCRPDVPDPGPE